MAGMTNKQLIDRYNLPPPVEMKVVEKNNPIFYHPGGQIYEGNAPYEEVGFYFWDELWVDYHGPYKTLDQCINALETYARSL